MNPTFTRSAGRSDKRREPRVRVLFPARYASPNLNLEGQVTDVSPDGMFFCSDFLDDQGATVRVWVEVPYRDEPLELRGEVRWVNDAPHSGGMGLRLIDVSLEDRKLLLDLGRRLVRPLAAPGHA